MSRPRGWANPRRVLTVLEARFDGWTNLRWNDAVLIGTDPTGREWSIGELTLSPKRRVSSAVLLGPTGELLKSWRFTDPRNVPIERARVQVSLYAAELGAQFKEVPWKSVA